MFLKIFGSHKTSNLIQRLPLGPWKLPIIGNMHHLVGSLPYHILRNLANISGPLCTCSLVKFPLLLFPHQKLAAKEIMRTNDNIFAFRPLLLAPDIISYSGASIGFAPYREYWRQMCKICGLVLLNSTRMDSFNGLEKKRYLICSNSFV
ncbi:putative premnaspirodiene oxygenase [Rosa chinensis]|uniref:Putative premnaspirodiene oxygenase n=1 Tax=Rosa chinensis TaxID=74649 RepID=A0A2P6QG75_ROSCH|nr:putative premnaspirodiene oxygenase [Rosa chinensis]